jgi:WD40 repeat protein
VVILADVATGKAAAKLAHGAQVSCVAFAPDGKTLASAIQHSVLLLAKGECKIKLWNATTKKEQTTLPGHDNSVLALAFTPDGKALASAGLIIPKVITVGSPDEQYGATVKRWDTKTNKELASLKVKGIPLTFSPDGKTVATASYEHGWIKLWDAQTGKERATLKTGSNRRAAFNPKGTVLATSYTSGLGRDRPVPVELWDIATGKKVAALKGHTNNVEGLAFSADGKLLASASKDGTVRLWDVDKGKQVACVKAHANGALCVAISPDGKTIASGGRDNTTKLWDVAKVVGKKADK